MVSVSKVFNRLKWLWMSKKMKSVGKNIHIGNQFSVIGAQFIEIGNDFSGGRNLKIHAFEITHNKPPEIIIGKQVTITDNCYLSAAGRISIGDGTLFGENTFVCDNFHGDNTYWEMNTPPNDREITFKGPVSIGKNVWIGRNVCIMPGVSIGDGSVIGANAVVTHNIPQYSVAAGVPAVVISENKDSFSSDHL